MQARTCVLTSICILPGYSSCPNAYEATFLAHNAGIEKGKQHRRHISAWMGRNAVPGSSTYALGKTAGFLAEFVNCTDNKDTRYLPRPMVCNKGLSLPRYMLQHRWGSYQWAPHWNSMPLRLSGLKLSFILASLLEQNCSTRFTKQKFE